MRIEDGEAGNDAKADVTRDEREVLDQRGGGDDGIGQLTAIELADADGFPNDGFRKALNGRDINKLLKRQPVSRR